MRIAILVLFAFYASAVAAEPCHYLVIKDDTKRYEQEGQTYIVFNEKDLLKLNGEPCFYPQKEADNVKSLIKNADDYQKMAREYQELTEKIKNLNRKYNELAKAHEATLDRSVELTEKYRDQVEKYKQQIAKYDALVVKVDKLAGEYREVALSTSSFISLDIAGGATRDKGAAAMLGIGIKSPMLCDQVKAWGIYQSGNSGGLLGCSFSF